MLGRRGGDDDKVFAFNAESWPSCIDTVVQLTEVFRQKDERFVACVSCACRACHVRVGVCVVRRVSCVDTSVHPTHQIPSDLERHQAGHMLR
jgi:hypothetical protein